MVSKFGTFFFGTALKIDRQDWNLCLLFKLHSNLSKFYIDQWSVCIVIRNYLLLTYVNQIKYDTQILSSLFQVVNYIQ